MSEYKNTLKEAVLRDPEFGEQSWKDFFLEKAENNIIYKKAMKEYILSDVSQALGKVHDIAVEAAKKKAIGRELIWTIPVKEPLTRFYLAKRGKAWRISETSPQQTPERFETIDVSVNYEYGYDALFSQSYIEDLPFDVIKKALEDAAQILEEQLTRNVTTLYKSIPPSELAGGTEIEAHTTGTISWTDLVKAWTEIKKTGCHADAALIHPDQFADLWNDDKFIHSFYFGEKLDVKRGLLGESYLGFTIIETDLCIPGKCHLIDTKKAAVLTLRRDILTQPYEERLSQGVICTIRYGLGALRKNAVARIVNC